MHPFIHEDFLLSNNTARSYYHDYAKHLPIIDFHNHLAPKDIAQDRIFNNISQLWLEGDHYKWRAMRACGIEEASITGKSGDWEKFKAWATVVPKMLRNPLYHWTHLELFRYFGINELLCESSSKRIFDLCNQMVESPNYSVRNLLRKMNVEHLCSTEDPTDELNWHRKVAGDFEITFSAAFRPDRILNIYNNAAFNSYIQQLEKVCDNEIQNYKDLCDALEKRHNYFHDFGTRLSDIALDWFRFIEVNNSEADRIFKKAIQKNEVTLEESDAFRTSILSFICELNFNKHWAQQFHLGALRNVNMRAYYQFGDATGFDSIGDKPYVTELGKLLNKLELKGVLARSIFFNLNPKDNAALIALINSFNDSSVEGKMQYGPAWWFLDQKHGIEEHLNDVSVYGVLGVFIGMITDSRSFLSFPRHEYFRRILCNLLGTEVEDGLIPNDSSLIKTLVENICYFNAKKYLNLIL